jgi:uncharacterized protein involved in exopolysaccharide biosynthesis/Mrp family chromosome partitioning ATPase
MIESGTHRETMSLSAALAMLRRRRYTIAIPLAAGLVAGWVGYQNSSRIYVSEAVLALDVRRVQALPSDAILSPLPQESPVLRTELDVINSRLMASSVVQKLQNQGVSFLMEESGRHRFLTSLGLGTDWMSALARAPQAAQPDAEEVQRDRIDYLLSRLRVSNDGRSYTIFISFSSADPGFSAAAANAFAAAYLDHQISIQQTAMRRVTDWLGSTLVNLRSGLEASEKAAESFRQGAGLIHTNGATLQEQAVSALRAQLTAVQGDTAATRARLETIRALSSGSEFPAMAETLQSATIQNLRIEQNRLERQLDELKASQATKSKDVPVLTAQLEALDRQIRSEVDRQIESLENEITVMGRKEASLVQALGEAQRQLAAANAAQVTLAQLEREAAANRTIYESFLVRYKQAIEQDGIAAAEARIISAAEPAAAPAKPQFSGWMAFGLGLGAAAAGGGVLLREATDRRWRLRDTLEEGSGVPVLAALPRLSWRERRDHAQGRVLRNPEMVSAYALLRRALRNGTTQTAAVVVTSAGRGEGKTSVTLGIARSAATAGMKVAVVDGDMRAPSVARMLGVRPARFLDELTADRVDPADVVGHDPSSGIDYVAGRPTTKAPEAILNSRAFRALIAKLEASHDLVLIDTPGLASTPDALDILAPTSRVLFVAAANMEPTQSLLSAVARLAACGSLPVGIVLTRVDPHLPFTIRLRQSQPGERARPMA